MQGREHTSWSDLDSYNFDGHRDGVTRSSMHSPTLTAAAYADKPALLVMAPARPQAPRITFSCRRRTSHRVLAQQDRRVCEFKLRCRRGEAA